MHILDGQSARGAAGENSSWCTPLISMRAWRCTLRARTTRNQKNTRELFRWRFSLTGIAAASPSDGVLRKAADGARMASSHVRNAVRRGSCHGRSKSSDGSAEAARSSGGI